MLTVGPMNSVARNDHDQRNFRSMKLTIFMKDERCMYPSVATDVPSTLIDIVWARSDCKVDRTLVAMRATFFS